MVSATNLEDKTTECQEKPLKDETVAETEETEETWDEEEETRDKTADKIERETHNEDLPRVKIEKETETAAAIQKETETAAAIQKDETETAAAAIQKDETETAIEKDETDVNEGSSLQMRRKDMAVGNLKIEGEKNRSNTLYLLGSIKEKQVKMKRWEIYIMKFMGGCFASVICLLYFFIPIVFGYLVVWTFYSQFRQIKPFIYLIIFLTLALLPTVPSECLYTSRLYESFAHYFESEVYSEETLEQLNNHPKSVLSLACPHGVISFGGISTRGLVDLREIWTAVATVLLLMPIQKHILGIFGIIKSSKKHIYYKLYNERKDVILYPGGLAELYLCNSKVEQLYFKKRKGCVRLAMEAGADIRIFYYFGNTNQLSVVRPSKSGLLHKFSRMMRSSFVYFWGLGNLPLPKPAKTIAVVSRVIEVPDYSMKSLDPKTRGQRIPADVVDSIHDKVMEEIRRVYETHRVIHPEYNIKPLVIY